MNYNDISLVVDCAYKLADIIKHGNYSNVFYFEFHEEIDISKVDNWESGMEAFSERSYSYGVSLFSDGLLDQTPSIIHIALKIDSECAEQCTCI